MINTIFWFANDYNDYERERDGQGISDKTIVFVKETGEIYVNNRKYGKTLQDIVNDPEMTDIFKDSTLKEEIQQMIDQLEGKHDLDIETLESKHDQDVELLRGLINANKASQDQDKEELDRKIDTTKTDLTTEINNAITTTGAAVSDSESRLNSSITTLNNLVNTNKTIADNAISNLQTSYNNLSGAVGTDIANALKDANGRTIWNRIDTADGNISAITNRINTSLDADGNIKNTSVLQGLIRTYSKTYDDSGLQAAVAELGTKWALLDENERILKWLASGFTSETTQYTTFAAMYAAGGAGGTGNNQNVEPGQPYEPEGYAELKATVEEINGAYLARTELGSLSRADLSTAFSGMATEAYADGIEERAVATITNKINNKEISAISGLYSAVGTAQSTADDAKEKADKAIAQSALFASMNDSYDPNDETTWGISSATINWVNFDKAVSEVITQYKPNNGDSSSAAAIKTISTVNSAGESLDTIVNNAVDLKFANTSFATTSQLETVDGKATGAMTATTNLVNAVGELDPNTGQIKKDTQGNPVLLSSASILSEARSAKNSADENSAKLDILSTAYNFDFSDSGDKKTTWITNAGLLTSAGLGTAMASLIAQEESKGSNGNVDATKEPTVAQIIAAIKNHKSSLELSADDIDISTGNFTVQADKINMEGQTVFKGNIQAIVGDSSTEISGNQIKSGKVSATYLDGDNLHVKAANIDDKLEASQIKVGDISIGTNQVTGLETLISNKIVAEELTASDIVGKLNDDNTSSLKIKADKINIGGVSIASSQVTGIDQLVADKIAATNITANALSIKNNNNVVVSAMNSDGSGWIGNDGTSKGMTWNTTGGITLNNTFLQSLVTALAKGVTNNETVKGYGVEVSMPGTNIPPTLTVLGTEMQLISVDASWINYFDFVTDSSQYPYNGSLAEKRAWVENAVNGWRLVFISGILQGKQSIDLYSNKTFDQLTASELDSRVNYVHKYTNAELAAIFGKDESKYVGIHTTSEVFNDSIGGSVGDWGLVKTANNSTDQLQSIYRLIVKTSSGWGMDKDYTMLYSQSRVVYNFPSLL